MLLQDVMHPKLQESKEALEKLIPCIEMVYSYYLEFNEKLRIADLYGKTIEVNERQFPRIYTVAKEIALFSDMDIIPMYVYEDFSYGIEAKGVSQPWIEISAKTIRDLPLEQIRFLLARQYFLVKSEMVRLGAIAEQFLLLSESASMLPFNDIVSKGFKLKYSSLSRLAHYSADNYGYIAVKDMSVCINAIVALILNSVNLAANIELKSYLSQADKIDRLSDAVSMYTKMDEKIPYGPYRIKNLISFASNNKRMEN